MHNRWFPASALLVACSSSSNDIIAPGADSGATASDADAAPPANDADILTVSMQLTVPPATELHRCQFVVLPTDVDVEAVALSHAYTLGSHHFLLFQTDLDTIPGDLTGQYDCVNGDEPVMLHTQGVLYGGQAPVGQVTLPPGVGLPLKARQVLLMQTHYINGSAMPLDSTVSMSFTTTPAGQVQTEAGFLVFYDPFIDVPAESSASSGIRCGVPADVTLVTASSHYHQRGTGMLVWNDPAPGELAAEPFYQTHDWEHPASFTGPMRVAAGSILRLRCDYSNPDPTEVFQGPNATTSEMCVLGAVYYPKRDDGFRACSDLSVVGTGPDACGALMSCVEACPGQDAPKFSPGGVSVGPCWERCVARGCDGATDALLRLTTCVSRTCGAQCAAGADACIACAATSCGTAYQSCAAQTCPN